LSIAECDHDSSDDETSTAPSTAAYEEDDVSSTPCGEGEGDKSADSHGGKSASGAMPAKETSSLHAAKVKTKSSFAALDDVEEDVPDKGDVTMLRNVSIQDVKFCGLLQQTRDLSVEIFDEDCLHSITKKSGWKLSLLITSDLSTLCGFIVSQVTKKALWIAKIAVRTEFRRHGFGKLIMEETIKSARKQGDISQVTLSSLEEAVKFYRRLGFKAFMNLKIDASRPELQEGQVYMQKKLQPRRK
jgi:ribosomal protein S18 acetylase RimI-like enzyme